MKTYKIDDSASALECDTELAFVNLTQSLLSNRLIFFLGAGLSREYPSLLPLAMNSSLPGLRELLAEMLITGVNIDLRESICEDLNKLTLEHILDQCARILGEDALDYLDILDSSKLTSKPNYRHYALALLAKQGFCPYFLTVNFDTLLEQAFDEFDVALVVPEEFDDEELAYKRAMKNLNNRNYIFKLHGTIDKKANLLTTVEKIANGLPGYKQALLQRMCSEYDIFFIGYSNNDLDTFPLIKRVASDHKVFWYEHTDIPSRPIRTFLLTRRHQVLVANLDRILQIILERLSISDEPIFSRIGISSLAEIQASELEDTQRRKDEILHFSSEFNKRFISPEATALILSNTVGVDKADLRRNLFDSIDRKHLTPNLLYSYFAELAEANYNVGALTSAIENRKIALGHLRSARFSPSYAFRTLLEQESRLRGNYLASLMKGHTLSSFIPIVIISIELRLRLLLQNQRLSSFDRGTFRSMLHFHSGSRWQSFAEKLLLKIAANETNSMNGVKDRLMNSIAQLCASIAEFRYRRAMKLDRQSAGWSLLHTQRLAEVIMHRKRKCTDEARKLIFKTREWGIIEDSKEGPEEYLGPHEGLMLFYQNNYSEAIRILNLTSDYYDKTNHLTGKLKSILFTILCYRELGEDGEVRNYLSRYHQLSKDYT